MTTLNYRNGWHLAQLNLTLLVLESHFKPAEVIKIESLFRIPVNDFNN